jgi:hypothetical protein
MMGSPFFLNRAMAEFITSTLRCRLALRPGLMLNHLFWMSITNSAGLNIYPNSDAHDSQFLLSGLGFSIHDP